MNHKNRTSISVIKQPNTYVSAQAYPLISNLSIKHSSYLCLTRIEFYDIYFNVTRFMNSSMRICFKFISYISWVLYIMCVLIHFFQLCLILQGPRLGVFVLRMTFYMICIALGAFRTNRNSVFPTHYVSSSSAASGETGSSSSSSTSSFFAGTSLRDPLQ